MILLLNTRYITDEVRELIDIAIERAHSNDPQVVLGARLENIEHQYLGVYIDREKKTLRVTVDWWHELEGWENWRLWGGDIEYEVQRKKVGAPAPIILGKTSKMTWVDQSVVEGTTYQYAVRVCDKGEVMTQWIYIGEIAVPYFDQEREHERNEQIRQDILNGARSGVSG